MSLLAAKKGVSPIVPQNKGVNCQVASGQSYFYCGKFIGAYWTLSRSLFLQ